METSGIKGGKKTSPPGSLYVAFAILSKANVSKPPPVPGKTSRNFTLLTMTHRLLETTSIQIRGEILLYIDLH